jgi:hypothetical protein
MPVAGIILTVTLLCHAGPGTFILGASAVQGEIRSDQAPLWQQLLADSKALKLPTRFLEEIPPGFVRFEFDDLRTFAAEYHPAEHRMVLDRGLSFNRAGRALRPLRKLTHKELQTLYHELFHAYMDFLTDRSMPSSQEGWASDSLVGFAREQQRCRYERVLITPILQRQAQTEERFLSDEESWEVLNETWAVFVGWAVWTQLELTRSKSAGPADVAIQKWIERLRKANQDMELRGYYEPRDPAERAIAQKRFVAPAYRISPPEVGMLMREVLEAGPDRIDLSVQVLEQSRAEVPFVPCEPPG